jgi:hypothetical protein
MHFLELLRLRNFTVQQIIVPVSKCNKHYCTYDIFYAVFVITCNVSLKTSDSNNGPNNDSMIMSLSTAMNSGAVSKYTPYGLHVTL